MDYSDYIKDKLSKGLAKTFEHGTSKIKPLQSFEDKLASITTEEELYGFANRRRVLGVNLPEWSDNTRACTFKGCEYSLFSCAFKVISTSPLTPALQATSTAATS